MKRAKYLIIVCLLLIYIPLFAQGEPAKKDKEEKLPDGGVEVELAFVSNYVFRGLDVFGDRAVQNGKSYGSSTGAFAFQPSITLSTPVEGLSFNIWGSFAMEGRNDQDVDQVLQTGPGGSDVLDPNNLRAAFDSYIADIRTKAQASDFDLTSLEPGGDNGVPNFYKESNGLKRSDEIDFTIDYSTETKKGNVGFGIVTYILPGTVGKDGYGAITEIYVNYAFPFFTDLTFAVNAAFTDARYEYYNIGYSKDIELSKTLSLSFGVGAGYQVQEGLQGWTDVTGSVGVSVGGFSVAFNVVNRPDLRFFDGDGASTPMPMWLYGGSTTGDGLVADPAKTNGWLNTYVNNEIGTQIGATYTPRQKLPSMLYYMSYAYTIEL